MHGENVQVIFGLKLKQFREAKGLALKDLAEQSGLSPSYLTEIEKGKKHPKTDKIMSLAQALGVTYDDMVSLKLERELNPLNAILDSPVIRDLPLQLFGLSQHDIVALMTRAPNEAGALIRTLVEIARSYDMQVEHFFYAMLRSYQEAHDNYFEEIEVAVAAYRAAQGWGPGQPLTLEVLRQLMADQYQVAVDETALDAHPGLKGFRSVWVEGPPEQVLLNGRLSSAQKAFQLGREIGYRHLGLKERGITSSRAEVTSFDQVLNDFRASYFAGALLLDQELLVQDLTELFAEPRWDGERFLRLLERYDVSPEMFLYRLTQVIPRRFGLRQLHFLRFNNVPGSGIYRLTKQFNMSQVPIPTGIGLNEHHCRRWLSVEALQELEARQKRGDLSAPVIAAQRSIFLDRGAEFFCITLARPLALTAGTNTSVTVGFSLTEELKQVVRWWDDPAIPLRELNETCERCGLAAEACQERAAPPIIHEQHVAAELRRSELSQLIATHREAGRRG